MSKSCQTSITGWSNLRVDWTDAVAFRCTWEHQGAPARKTGSANDKHGSTWESRWQASEHRQRALEHLKSLWSSLGVTTSSLGTLLERLEIIATTYRSMIFKTQVFSVYYHLCIYIATHLHTVYLDRLQVVVESNSRCGWRCASSELRDTLGGRDRAGLEKHWEGVI